MVDDSSLFEEKLLRLQEITDGLDTYGEGKRYEQATRYYLEHLVSECAQRERARALSPGLPDEVDLLISLTGHSPRLTILAYEILQPRRLVIIPSDDVEDSLNTIQKHVLAGERLEPAAIISRRCEPTDPLGIYNIVKEELASHARRADAVVGDTFIDITAGRKVMAASAALAAWQLDVRLCYIDGDYVDGRAVPGSDRLLLLDNPSSLFGENAMAAAEQAFASGAFEAARNRFDELAKRLARPAQARFMGALSALYRAWCDLELSDLPTAISRVRDTVGAVRRNLPAGTLSALFAQLDYLHRLADGDEAALLMCFSILSDHYRQLGRHDFAALYSYRTIEGCLSARLAARHRGFAYRPMDYEGVGVERQALQDRFRSLVSAVRGQTVGSQLPREPRLFSSAVLLAALGDSLAHAARLSGPDELRKLERLAKARNQSVLAHGTQPVKPEIAQSLHEQAMAVLRAFWSIHYPNEDLNNQLARLTFIRSVGGE